jgi:hypothetical protein
MTRADDLFARKPWLLQSDCSTEVAARHGVPFDQYAAAWEKAKAAEREARARASNEKAIDDAKAAVVRSRVIAERQRAAADALETKGSPHAATVRLQADQLDLEVKRRVARLRGIVSPKAFKAHMRDIEVRG